MQHRSIKPASFVAIYLDAFKGLQPNVWVLSITSFVNRSGSMVLFFTSLYLTRSLGIAVQEAGIIMGFYGIGSISGSYAGGWLADRFRNKTLMFLSMLVSALVLLNMLWIKNPAGIASVMFLYAFTADIFRPANSAAIAACSSDANLTRSVSLVRLAVNLGFSVGPALGGIIAASFGYTWLYILDAITSAAAGIYLLLKLDDRGMQQNRKKTDEDVRAPSAYKDVFYLVFILLTALYALCFFQFFASIPQYFSRSCQYNEDIIGYLLAFNGLLVVIIELPLVALLEKRGNISRFIIMGAGFFPLSILALLLLPCGLPAAILYTFLITFSEILAMPFMMNISLMRAKKGREGQYAALYSIGYGLANIIAPAAGLGIAGYFGFQTLFVVLLFLGLICTLGFARLFANRNSSF